MRRRATEFRRPVRRRFSHWIWFLLGLFVTAGLILFVVHHNNHEDRIKQAGEDEVGRGLNMTEELTSVTSYARQLSEEMTLAKAYVVIAKEHGNLRLAWELSAAIRDCQRLLSKEATMESPLTHDEAAPVIRTMSLLIYRAGDEHYDVATTLVTMKSHIQALEDRAKAATVQSTVLGRLAASSLPRPLHCLTVELTAAYPSADEGRRSPSPRFVDNNLYHFCIFSGNVMAASVVVNSTVSAADHPKQHVFHIVADGVSCRAMRYWFDGNDAVEVRCADGDVHLPSEPFDRLRFHLADLYPHLEKVVLLEDDVVVQKDLTPLFSVDLHGNVNAAVETCLDGFHRYHRYLNFSDPAVFSRVDPQACVWAFGVNVLDLVAWRKADVAGRYRYWTALYRDGNSAVSVGLLVFYGLTEPLDRRWHVLGLGYDPGLDDRLINSAAVVHFNGHLKPWLDVGFRRYRPLWERHVDRQNPLVRKCFGN